MRRAGVGLALSVTCSLEEFEEVAAIARDRSEIYASVGVHPNYQNVEEPDESALLERAAQKKVVAIGETGLDYYRTTGDVEWQKLRFRTHIRAARACGKPLIVHSRAAPGDTVAIMVEEGAAEPGGVMHCFSEGWETAQAALDLGFYISFSGIVTFKNARQVQEVARKVPLDRMLIETDSPYLAPVPFRGKLNQPAYVKYVAEEIARLHGIAVERVAEETTANFKRLFRI
jgi:TatD DNase family protein